MKPSLKSYKLGLGVIGLLTVILLVFVLIQAGPTKQDVATYNAAVNIADQLNNYTYNSYTPPNTLADAGITNVPPSILYIKLSATKYRFCIDYKTNSSVLSQTPSPTEFMTLLPIGSNNPSLTSSDGYLVISPDHHKGDNCQTITNTFGSYQF